jgi:acetyl esterase
VYIYFHGGGWATGSIADADPHCRNVCADAGVVVVNVGYPLAPEHCYPAALEDAYAVLLWIADAGAARLGVDPTRIAVGGTSSGANIAAVLCLMVRDRGGPKIDFQYLDVAPLDATMSSPSIRENGEGFLLTADALRFMYTQYLGDHGEAGEKYVSPLLADDLSGMPDALIVTADCDPLRDDGLRYAERLRSAGADVCVHNYPGMIHGFTALELLTPSARQAHEELIGALERLHRVDESAATL